jgi:hypothetical protein
VAESCGLMQHWSSTIRNTSLGPVAQAFLPVFWGWAMAIFIFLTTPVQPKCAQSAYDLIAQLQTEPPTCRLTVRERLPEAPNITVSALIPWRQPLKNWL